MCNCPLENYLFNEIAFTFIFSAFLVAAVPLSSISEFWLYLLLLTRPFTASTNLMTKFKILQNL